MINSVVIAKTTLRKDGQVVIEQSQDYELFDVNRMVNAERPDFLIYSERERFEYVDSFYFRPDYDDDEEDDIWG